VSARQAPRRRPGVGVGDEDVEPLVVLSVFQRFGAGNRDVLAELTVERLQHERRVDARHRGLADRHVCVHDRVVEGGRRVGEFGDRDILRVVLAALGVLIGGGLVDATVLVAAVCVSIVGIAGVGTGVGVAVSVLAADGPVFLHLAEAALQIGGSVDTSPVSAISDTIASTVSTPSKSRSISSGVTSRSPCRTASSRSSRACPKSGDAFVAHRRGVALQRVGDAEHVVHRLGVLGVGLQGEGRALFRSVIPSSASATNAARCESIRPHPDRAGHVVEVVYLADAARLDRALRHPVNDAGVLALCDRPRAGVGHRSDPSEASAPIPVNTTPTSGPSTTAAAERIVTSAAGVTDCESSSSSLTRSRPDR